MPGRRRRRRRASPCPIESRRRRRRRLPTPGRATVKDFVDHIDYAVKLIGIDHVGISSDFDGGGGIDGWNSAAETFNVTLELVRRGYSEEEIAQALERQPASRVARGREGREAAAGGGQMRGAAGWLAVLACLAAQVPLAGVREPVRARHAMVIAQQPADEAGLAVLRQGGNAIDAAIAIGFALNAAYPYAGALGAAASC